jgi:hypothetical protein
VYGLPSPELFEAAERGEIILGGCCPPLVDGLDPHFELTIRSDAD